MEEGRTLNIGISKVGETLVVTTHTPDDLQPLTMTATPEDFDKEFISQLSQSHNINNEFKTSMADLKKEADEKAKKDADKKEKEAAKKKKEREDKKLKDMTPEQKKAHKKKLADKEAKAKAEAKKKATGQESFF